MNKNFKILIITPAYWPAIDYGGPIQAVKLLAEQLKKQDNYVEVLTLSYGLNENKLKIQEVDGIKVTYLKYFKFYRWYVPYGLFKWLFKNRNNFDIFHINLIWDPISWFSGFVLAFFNRKIIISPRGTIEESLIKGRSYFLKKLIYFVFIKFIFFKTLGFHFTSEKEKDEFFKFSKFDKPFTIVPNLFDYKEFQKPKDKNLLDKFGLKNKKYILYFGRINWKKRIELLIDAFLGFQKENQDFYLAIIGSADKDYFEKLKNKIKELNLDDKVILRGETISGDLKIALYQNAWCFVLPSISENFGYVVVEAMASSLPVIISDGVGLKELVLKYNAGLVFGGNDYEELKNNLFNKLKELLNEEKRKFYIENGFHLLKNEFNNENLTKKMLEFYYKFTNQNENFNNHAII